MSVIALVLVASSTLVLQVPPVQGEPKEFLKMSIIDVQTGTGDPAASGKRYKVHYTGWLRDGTKFDSSRDKGEPFQFVQGRRQVIAGWEAGFEGMRVGGKRRPGESPGEVTEHSDHPGSRVPSHLAPEGWRPHTGATASLDRRSGGRRKPGDARLGVSAPSGRVWNERRLTMPGVGRSDLRPRGGSGICLGSRRCSYSAVLAKPRKAYWESPPHGD